jgi:hypothetical protein
LYLFTRRLIKLTVVIIEGYRCYQFHFEILSSTHLSRVSPYVEEVIGNYQCWFRFNRMTADQILCIHQALEAMGYNETVHQLFTHFKKASDSVRRKVLYNILIEI